MAAILFTDTEGPAVVRSRWPAPADRFMAWAPLTKREGVRDVVLGTGVAAEWVYRVDTGVMCELRGISAHSVTYTIAQGEVATGLVNMADRAQRLIPFLIGGGTVTVKPEGPAGGLSYTCVLLPGTTPDLRLADPRQMEYTLTLALKNLGGTRMPYPYPATLPAGS